MSLFGESVKVKNSKYASSDLIFERTEVEFKDFKTYINNYADQGDWVIPIGEGLEFDMEFSPSHDYSYDDEEFVRKYDPSLVKVYRKNDDVLKMKNIKMLGSSKRIKDKGWFHDIWKMIGFADKMIGRLRKDKVERFCNTAKSIYDSKMMDNTTKQVSSIHVWVPVWRTICDKGLLITVLEGRINFIIT